MLEILSIALYGGYMRPTLWGTNERASHTAAFAINDCSRHHAPTALAFSGLLPMPMAFLPLSKPVSKRPASSLAGYLPSFLASILGGHLPSLLCVFAVARVVPA